MNGITKEPQGSLGASFCLSHLWRQFSDAVLFGVNFRVQGVVRPASKEVLSQMSEFCWGKHALPALIREWGSECEDDYQGSYW